TNSWYYTESGTRKRVPLLDAKGDRIRGKDNKEAAQVALARIKLAEELNPPSSPSRDHWTVAKVCDAYLADLHLTANPAWAIQVERWLNDLCGYCGALTVSEFQKKHLRTWMQQHI
ncbi:MAG TPA: hypothetical protein QF761_00030, partial [Pirellulales bacterium]|nr:hypothetical protein [Pirellulales bacterium]